MQEKEHLLFRYVRGADVRVYTLRIVSGGVELWRRTEIGGRAPTEIMESDFSGYDAAAAFIEEVQRALTAGGWQLADEE